MNEDLIKRLRNCTSGTIEDCAVCPYQGGYKGTYCMNGLISEAADALEELSKQLLEMGQVGKFLLDVHKINSKMVAPESVPTDSEWWSHYKALLDWLPIPEPPKES